MRPRSRLLVASLLLAAVAAVPGTAAQGPFSLERILSAPFPSELTASPAGGHVAWVFDEAGSRNVWVASPPEYLGRPLTSYRGDDGQGIGDLRWTPDGESILYVRGSAPNRQGELPNPLSDPEGVERAIWVVDLEGGEPRRLAEGSGPRVSPRGDRVVFERGGQIWSVPLGPGAGPADAGGETTEPTGADDPADAAGAGEATPEQLLQVRSGATSPVLSPDGSRVAFVSPRGDHSYVGVYDLDAGELTWMDPGVDRDGSPVFSSDGDRVAFLRVPASREVGIFEPDREGRPWSIRVADVATGEGREVWRADPGRGSVFRGVDAGSAILWAGHRIVFPWERTGWTLLYAVDVPAAGEPAPEAELLTPGEQMVEDVFLGPDGQTLIYGSNRDDVDRRHLWMVSAAGGEPTLLTPGLGIEWSPAMTSDAEAVALLRSDARTPAHPAILTGDEAPRSLAPGSIPADFPLGDLVVPEQVVFPAADGMRIHGQLFLPSDAAAGDELPGVLFFHGGSRRQMLLGWHYLGYYHKAYALNQYLASRGYAVLSVNYRSGIGYGLAFREALDYGAAGASEFRDVLGAGLWLAARPETDPERIGLWGGSYGGYLTALGLARASDLFAAGVDFHGVHDWNVVIENFVPSYEPLEDPEAARVAFESSPMADVDTWRSPVLLIHGDDDRNVPFSETVDLVGALRDRGIEHELLVFPDEVHGFLTHSAWLRAYRATADFLDRKLR